MKPDEVKRIRTTLDDLLKETQSINKELETISKRVQAMTDDLQSRQHPVPAIRCYCECGWIGSVWETKIVLKNNLATYCCPVDGKEVTRII